MRGETGLKEEREFFKTEKVVMKIEERKEREKKTERGRERECVRERER